jgi:Ca2+-transporting ATPase
LKDEFETWQKAGIGIKLVTGDFKETAQWAAGLVGIPVTGHIVTGEEVMKASASDMKALAIQHSIFARMFPDAKLKLVDALIGKGEVVAMMGDGVNDGPALKAAHIGIAMGGRGTEIAMMAADLVLTDDNLGSVTEAIRQGRKIYSNLKKAIRYIISIHVPIILTASLPLFLNWKFPGVFTPIHVIFLELIMGPTCSVFFENEPVSGRLMDVPPRHPSASFFSARELSLSLVQGGVIAAGVLGLYRYFMDGGYSLSYVRTVVFITLIIANIFLTFADRSFGESILKTLRYRNSLTKYVVGMSVFFLASLVWVPFLRTLFGLERLSGSDYVRCLVVGILSTLWVEILKRPSRMRDKNR